jgi:glycerol uptake facilitator-like aquaporin
LIHAGKFINEFVGTFYFAFIACMVSTSNGASTDGSGNSAGGASTDPMLAALAIGSALTASVYAGGHISGDSNL